MWCGVFSCLICLLCISVIWLDMVIVFFWLWVMIMKVIFRWFCKLINLNCVFLCNFLFNVFRGLFSNNSLGCFVNVLVKVICWCWLLDSWWGLWLVSFFSCIMVSILWIWFLCWVFVIDFCFKLKVMFFLCLYVEIMYKIEILYLLVVDKLVWMWCWFC